MFRTGSFILRILLALVLLAGVLGLTAMAFRSGYSRGYVMGVATNGEAPQLAPGFPGYPGIMPYRMHFFPPVGLFFCGGLLFIALLGAIFRPRHWHRHPAWAGHHGHGPWAHHWAHEHSHDAEHAAYGHSHGPEQTAQPPSADEKQKDTPSAEDAA